MRVPLFQPLIMLMLLMVVCLAVSDEVAETPKSTSLFGKIGNAVKGGKKRLGSIFSRRKRAVQEKVDNGENPLAEGVGAVMDVIDEIVADGEAAASQAAKDTKESVDKTKASVEETVAASQEMLSAASADAVPTVDAALKEAEAELDAAKDGMEGLAEEAQAEAAVAQEVVDEATKDVADGIEAASESSEEL